MVKRVNRKKMYIIAFALCIAVVNVGSLIISNADENEMTVEYHACTVNGWNNWVTSGQECKVNGTDGITRIEMHLKTETGDSADAGIEYSVASDAGWSMAVNGGDMASAAGQPIKAMNINVVGELANSYKAEYRACNSNGEWYAWESNGGVVGNINSEYFLTSIEIKVVKNETAQTTNNTPVQEEELLTNNDINYRKNNTIAERTNDAPVQEEELLTNNDINYRKNDVPATIVDDDIIEYPPTMAPEYTDENMIPEGKKPGDVVVEIKEEETGNTQTVGGTTNDAPVQEEELLTNNDINYRNINSTQEVPSGNQEAPSSNQEEETGTTPVESTVSEAAEELIKVAESQLGNGRDANNETVYGIWWADRIGNDVFRDAKWCAMFLSWCANNAGISEKTIGYYAACSYWQDSFIEKGRWQTKDGYKPVRGDIIFFDNNSDGDANHNGIVTSVTDKEVTALEGNVNDKVAYVTYSLNDSTIIGYGKPDYENNAAIVEKEEQKKQEEEKQVQQEEATGSTNQVTAILNTAIGEIGYKQGYGQATKYGQWYGDNIAKSNDYDYSAWCAMFVTWCANKAGIPTDVIIPYAYCPTGITNFENMGRYYKKGEYTPKPGDIIFFGFGSTYDDGTPRTDHTGIVEYVKDGYVHTVEGNTDFMVARRQYPINSGWIWGYGVPNYK